MYVCPCEHVCGDGGCGYLQGLRDLMLVGSPTRAVNDYRKAAYVSNSERLVLGAPCETLDVKMYATLRGTDVTKPKRIMCLAGCINTTDISHCRFVWHPLVELIRWGLIR